MYVDNMLTRDRFVIPRRLLPSAMLLGQSPGNSGGIPAVTLTELRRAGVVTNAGRLKDEAASLLGVMSDAALVSSIEVRGKGTESASTIWATTRGAAVGRQVDEDMCELIPIRPTSLPVVMAHIVEIGRRPEPPFFGAGLLADGALELALDRIADAPSTAIDILVAAGLDRTWADRLLIAHEHMRSHWSVSSVWTDQMGSHHVRSVSVLDGGAAGYWRIEAQPISPPSSRFSVVTLAQVMRLLRSTIPPTDTLSV